MANRVVLGVDGGNSKTWALAGDLTGRIAGWGKAGRGNHQTADLGPAGTRIACAAALAEALAEAGATVDAVVQAAFCLAGADLPSDCRMLTELVRAEWPGLSFTIHNDALAGMRAGASHNWGATVICGSGTNAVARSKDGREVQIGGLGYVYGDHGGGGDLGQEALRAAFQAAQGRGRPTLLVERVLAAVGQPDLDGLTAAVYEGRVARGFAHTLAPAVFSAASLGDEVAQEILIRMGTELGKAGGAALKAVGLEREDGVEVVLTGSVWKGGNPLMLDAFRLALHRVAPRAAVVRPRLEPVVGAYLLALEAAGITVGTTEMSNLQATLPADLRIPLEEE